MGKSRPQPLLAALSIGAVLAGLAMVMTPLGSLFGFTAPPAGLALFLVATVAAYLVLAEAVKRLYVARARAGRGMWRGEVVGEAEVIAQYPWRRRGA